MADNWTAVDGSGAAVTIAADEISSTKHQRVKVEYGADGSATDVDATHPLPVGSGDSDDAAPAGGLMPIAGIYQSTVDEVDAGDVGRLRMSARRGLLTAPDSNTETLLDIELRDTADHYLFPTTFALGRDRSILLENTTDQAITVNIFLSTPAGHNPYLEQIASLAAGQSRLLISGATPGTSDPKVLSGRSFLANPLFRTTPLNLYTSIHYKANVAPTSGNFRIYHIWRT
jgi:hypothetical protein